MPSCSYSYRLHLPWSHWRRHWRHASWPPDAGLSEAFADGHLAALDKQVGLSAEQKPQLRSVFLEEGKNLFAVFGDTTLSDTQKQARIQQIHVVTEHKVWAVLTHEQRKMMNVKPAPPPRQVT